MHLFPSGVHAVLITASLCKILSDGEHAVVLNHPALSEQSHRSSWESAPWLLQPFYWESFISEMLWQEMLQLLLWLGLSGIRRLHRQRHTMKKHKALVLLAVWAKAMQLCGTRAGTCILGSQAVKPGVGEAYKRETTRHYFWSPASGRSKKLY